MRSNLVSFVSLSREQELRIEKSVVEKRKYGKVPNSHTTAK